MAKIPKQRGSGQTGGGGRHGQAGNRGRSSDRGGNPYRGGGGQGKKPAGKSSSSAQGPVAGIVYAVAVFAVALVASPVAYLAWEYSR